MIFQWRQGLIWIEIVLEYGGKKYRISDCILDTGSAATAIDIDLIVFNFNQPSKLKRLSGVGGGTQEVVSQNVNKVSLGHVHLCNIPIEFGDLQNKYGINGFVGTDFLSQFRVDIDFPNQQIHFLTNFS